VKNKGKLDLRSKNNQLKLRYFGYSQYIYVKNHKKKNKNSTMTKVICNYSSRIDLSENSILCGKGGK